MYADRFPTPFEMQELTGAQRNAAAMLMHFTVQAVEGASVPFSSADGDSWSFSGEAATVIPDVARPESDTMSVERVELGVDDFAVTDEQGHETVVQPDAQSEELNDPVVSRLHTVARGVASGVLAGEHTATAVKVRAIEGVDDGPMTLTASVTRASGGNGETVTKVNLRYMRVYEDGGLDGQLFQIYQLEHDPHGEGVYRSGSTIYSEVIREVEGSYDPTTDTVAMYPDVDLLPALTAQIEQQRFQPETPVDRALTEQEWTDLVRGDLRAEDRLQHA